jgi:hypothetical protein
MVWTNFRVADISAQWRADSRVVSAIAIFRQQQGRKRSGLRVSSYDSEF